MKARRIGGWLFNLLGWILVVLSIPFLLHTIVVTVYGLGAGQPVPGWWWNVVGPVGAWLNWVLLAATFVLRLGEPLNYLVFTLPSLLVLGIGLFLLFGGRRMRRRGSREGENL